MPVQHLVETKGICPRCLIPLEKQLLRSMNGRNPFEIQGDEPPPMLDAVAVFPYKCPGCGHTEFEEVR